MKTEDLLITRETDAPLEAVCAQLPEVAQRHKFGVLGVHDLKQKMASKGVTFAPECRVFEVCNPQQAKEILSEALEVSTALPCRISVYEKAGRTILATIKPTAMLSLYDLAGGESTARAVEDTLIQIMDETVQS